MSIEGLPDNMLPSRKDDKKPSRNQQLKPSQSSSKSSQSDENGQKKVLIFMHDEVSKVEKLFNEIKKCLQENWFQSNYSK